MTRSDSFRDSSNHTSQEATLNSVADEPVVFRKALRSICSLRLDMTPRQVHFWNYYPRGPGLFLTASWASYSRDAQALSPRPCSSYQDPQSASRQDCWICLVAGARSPFVDQYPACYRFSSWGQGPHAKWRDYTLRTTAFQTSHGCSSRKVPTCGRYAWLPGPGFDYCSNIKLQKSICDSIWFWVTGPSC